MSRALPPCATCGRSMKARHYRGAITFIEFTEEPGRPRIGWYEDHFSEATAAIGGNAPEGAHLRALAQAAAVGRASYLPRSGRQPSDSNKSPNPAPGGDRSGVENER